MRDVWPLIASHHPRLVFVSYGSPYHLYEMPNLPLMVNAYSLDLNTQNAVGRVLTGERPATVRVQSISTVPTDDSRCWRA
jgi:hypothetical protein